MIILLKIIKEINKLFETNDENVENTKQNSNKIYKKLENIEFIFGEPIDEHKLIEFIKNAVKYIKCSYTEIEKNAIKTFFEIIKSNIYYNLKKKGIRDIVMRDLLITYFYKKKYEKFSLRDSNVPLYEIKVDEIKFNKDFLINAVRTKIIFDYYLKVCENYIDNFKINDFKNNLVKKSLIDHIKKMNIYFAELHEKICEFTIYTVDVIINAKYLNGIYSDDNPIKYECLACIFLTILYELAHCLTRILKKLNKNTNQFSLSVDLDSNINIKKIEIPSGYYENYEENDVPIFDGIMNQLNNEVEKEEKTQMKVIIHSMNQVAFLIYLCFIIDII